MSPFESLPAPPHTSTSVPDVTPYTRPSTGARTPPITRISESSGRPGPSPRSLPRPPAAPYKIPNRKLLPGIPGLPRRPVTPADSLFGRSGVSDGGTDDDNDDDESTAGEGLAADVLN